MLTVVVAVDTQPRVSVTVQVYVPGQSPPMVNEIPPEGAQLTVYTPDPPDAETLAVPEQAQVGVDDALDVSSAGSVMVTETWSVQPLASVTVQV